jgi:hypothetical protein
MANFIEIQSKTLEVQERKLILQEANMQARVKEMKLKEKRTCGHLARRGEPAHDEGLEPLFTRNNGFVFKQASHYSSP